MMFFGPLSTLFCMNRAHPKNVLSKSEGRVVLRSMYPHVPHPTVEHVVPVSLYKHDLKCHPMVSYDLHNLLLLPSKLNVHRSNYTFANPPSPTHGHRGQWVALNALGHECTWAEAAAFKHNQAHLFCPPAWCRGAIARKVAYFRFMYPTWSAAVETAVMSQGLMEEWNERYPVTLEERRVNILVKSIQRNANPFVLRPDQVHKGTRHKVPTMSLSSCDDL